jgi:hypothetical protein
MIAEILMLILLIYISVVMTLRLIHVIKQRMEENETVRIAIEKIIALEREEIAKALEDGKPSCVWTAIASEDVEIRVTDTTKDIGPPEETIDTSWIIPAEPRNDYETRQ